MFNWRLALAGTVLALGIVPASAADVIYVPNGVMAAPADGSDTNVAIPGRFKTIVVNRKTDTGAELHLESIDNIVVLDGDATLVYGDEMTDSHMISESEFRGTGITGNDAKTIALHKGDIIQIPAGMAQWFKPGANGIRYVTVRVGGRKEETAAKAPQ